MLQFFPELLSRGNELEKSWAHGCEGGQTNPASDYNTNGTIIFVRSM